MIDWIFGFVVDTIWDGFAELGKIVGGKGCYWLVILAPILLIAGIVLFLSLKP